MIWPLGLSSCENVLEFSPVNKKNMSNNRILVWDKEDHHSLYETAANPVSTELSDGIVRVVAEEPVADSITCHERSEDLLQVLVEPESPAFAILNVRFAADNAVDGLNELGAGFRADAPDTYLALLTDDLGAYKALVSGKTLEHGALDSDVAAHLRSRVVVQRECLPSRFHEDGSPYRASDPALSLRALGEMMRRAVIMRRAPFDVAERTIAKAFPRSNQVEVSSPWVNLREQTGDSISDTASV